MIRAGVPRAPAAQASPERPKPSAGTCSEGLGDGPCGTVALCGGTARERRPHQGRQRALHPRRRGAAADAVPGGHAHRRAAGRRPADAPAQSRGVRAHARSRLRLHDGGRRAFPGQRPSPIRHDRARDPLGEPGGPDVRGALAAAGDRLPRRDPPRPRPRHRPYRRGQDDDHREPARVYQPHAARAHRHDRGSDRGRVHRRDVGDPPARGRTRHRVLRRGAATGAAAGSRRHLPRGDPRRRNGARGDPGRADRAPRPLDDAHDRCRRDRVADRRDVPAQNSSRSASRSRARSAAWSHNGCSSVPTAAACRPSR